MLNLAIGQGELLLTPLQLALMTAQVSVNGRALRPHVIQRLGDDPSAGADRPVQSGVTADREVWEAMRRGLHLVVDAGTGTAARVSGVSVAGKTGTAQNPHGNDHALFVCYAPVEHPTIAMAIVVENSGHGGSVAAPLAGHVLRRLFLPDSLQRPAPAVAVAPAGDSAGVAHGD